MDTGGGRPESICPTQLMDSLLSTHANGIYSMLQKVTLKPEQNATTDGIELYERKRLVRR